MSKTRKTILFSTFLYVFMVMMTCGFTNTSAQSTSGFDESLLVTDLKLQNNNFDSFRIDYVGMTILNEVGQPIIRDGKPLSTTSQTWIDPLFQFPKVTVSYSQAFMTNQFFNEIPEDQLQTHLSRFEPTNKIQISDQDSGKVYYLKQYSLAFDVGVQTGTNFNPNKQWYDIMVSPLDNFYHSHRGRSDYDAFDAAGSSSTSAEPNVEGDWNRGINAGTYDINTKTNTEYGASRTEVDFEPMGVLGAWVGTGANPWKVVWVNQPTSPAAMRNSLEPLGDNRWGGNKWEFVGLTNGVGLPVKTVSDATAAFKSAQATAPNNGKWEYGNRNLIAAPSFRVTALSEFLKGFDYTTTKYINGQNVEIKVKTTSAKIGIYNALDAGPSFKLMGTVKNQLDAQKIRDQYHDVVPNPEASKATGEDSPVADVIPGNSARPGFTTYNLEVYFKQVQQITTRNPQIYQATTDPMAFTDNLPDVNQIDIPQFSTSVPTVFTANGQFQLAPVTSVNWAKYDAHCEYQFVDDYIFDSENTQNSINVPGCEYPYRLNVDNVYGVRRMGFKVAVLTENEAEVVVANGRPIKIDDFTEFNYNSLGELVDNYMKGSLSVTTFDLGKFFADLFSNPLLWVIVIGIIVVVIFVFVGIRRGTSSFNLGGMGAMRGLSTSSSGSPVTGGSFFKTQTGKITIYIILGLVAALVILIAVVAAVPPAYTWP